MIATHMPLDTFHTPVPEHAASRNGSILSKFSNPLTKRNRNIFDFTIEPEDHFKVYGPGEVVRGHVVLSVLKGFDITHLVIALHGFAKVFKHQQERADLNISDLINGQGSRGFEYRGNGLASLFQDEQILCGSGFLKKQVYKFGFELQFPSKGLPSSIEFERGTVSYMISATVTRPTTISPTTTSTQRVTFRDSIDIEPMYNPKVRVITLEPISRRGKMKKVKTSSSVSTQDDSSRKTLSRYDTQSSLPSGSTGSAIPPLSPAPSEETVATHLTASTGSFQLIETQSPGRKASPQTSETRSNMTSTSAHTITATTEIPRYGALAGDVVPIKVSVTHSKPNARGVIIATLYRLGRIDMHPILPLATKGKEKRKEYEDVYPKSRTGLGGLYFANSSPSSVFRKDLSQSSTMMIVNPQTLTAEVRTSMKVPDDVFPSISNVPGGMISFTYHVEVVIDLTGKLGETRFLPSLTSNGPTFTSGTDNGNQISSDWDHSILDTTSLRRTKSVVTIELPLVVGTKDSRRTRSVQPTRQFEANHQQLNGDGGHDDDDWEGHMYDAEAYQQDGHDGFYYDEYGNPLYDDYYGYDYNNGYHEEYDYNHAAPPALLAPPVQESAVDEKTRLRQREALLLPSEPPLTGESSTQALHFEPTAPSFDMSESLMAPSTVVDSIRPSLPTSASRASARSTETIVPTQSTPPPDLPEDQQTLQNDDKQELERQRLMAQASAPPQSDAAEGSFARGLTSETLVATAPTFDEADEEYLSRVLHNEHIGPDHLPEYHR